MWGWKQGKTGRSTRQKGRSLKSNSTFLHIRRPGRVGISGHKSLLCRVNQKALIEVDTTIAVHLPMSERVLDKLADILFATDEILGMVRPEERMPDATTVFIAEAVQSVYDQVNELMKKLAD